MQSESWYCHRIRRNALRVRKFHVTEMLESREKRKESQCPDGKRFFYGWRGSRSNKLRPVLRDAVFVYRFAFRLFISVSHVIISYMISCIMSRKIAFSGQAAVDGRRWRLCASRKFASLILVWLKRRSMFDLSVDMRWHGCKMEFKWNFCSI